MAGTNVAQAFVKTPLRQSTPIEKGGSPTGGGSVEAANTGLAGIYQSGDKGDGSNQGNGQPGGNEVLAQYKAGLKGGVSNTAVVRTAQSKVATLPVFGDTSPVDLYKGKSHYETLSLGELGSLRGGLTARPKEMMLTKIAARVRDQYGGQSQVATAALRGPGLPGGGESFVFNSDGFWLASPDDPELGDMSYQIRSEMQDAHLQPRAKHRDHVKNGRYAILRA